MPREIVKRKRASLASFTRFGDSPAKKTRTETTRSGNESVAVTTSSCSRDAVDQTREILDAQAASSNTTGVSSGVASNDADDNTSTVVIPPRTYYLNGLRCSQRLYQLESGHIIVADCNPLSGELTNNYVILDRKSFHCTVEGSQMDIYLCKCPAGSAQRDRLLPMCSLLVTEFYDFYYKETDNQCCHAEAATSFLDDNVHTYTASVVTDVDLPNVQQLSAEPLLVVVETETGIELLQQNRNKTIVCTCSHGKRHCQHKTKYHEWTLEQSVQIIPQQTVDRPASCVFTCISKQRIKTPLTPEQQELYRNYESGQQSFPVHLTPRIPTNQPSCSHGFEWDTADPVEEGWVVGKATIYKEGCSLTHLQHNGSRHAITVYYRRSSGDCNCKLDYDGYDDLLLNLNNSDMVYYGLLFSYLHHMLEGRNPLAACHRAYAQSHLFLSSTKCIAVHKLRLAWNAFARLLDIAWTQSFSCPECGDAPKTVICDGTTLGCRKDLLHQLQSDNPPSDSPPIAGSIHKNRVYVNDAKTRKLLAAYAISTVTPAEYQELLSKLQRLNLLYLLDIVKAHPGSAPAPLSSLLTDLSRNGPACAFFQGTNSEDIEKLKTILNSTAPMFRSDCRDDLYFIQRQLPVVFNILSRSQVNGNVSVGVRYLLLDILKTAERAYTSASDSVYSAPNEEHLFSATGFFPALPKLHRKANYKLDKTTESDQTCRNQTECKKYARGHPTLSPGIFTVFCPHGVCYGFEVMTRYESPEVPFTIFKTRFRVAPEVIIYDNACRLHAYCLNREPEFFRQTIFVVDRLHWHNHRSCSSGYNVDAYGTRLDLNRVNTQVNEQANAGLARIKSQLSYMLPANFIFNAALYLSFKNAKKKASLC